MITYIVSGIFVFFAGLFIADSTIETIVLDKRINTLTLDRYDIYCNNKHTRLVSTIFGELIKAFRDLITLREYTQ